MNGTITDPVLQSLREKGLIYKAGEGYAMDMVFIIKDFVWRYLTKNKMK